MNLKRFMRKSLECVVCTMLLGLLFCAVDAEADLKRGDSGNSVLNMQTELKELGFLDGAVDGKFGPITEKAVHAWYWWRWNSKGSGVMTDEDLYWLDAIRGLAFGQEENADEADTDSLPASCCRTGDSVLHCERHLTEQTLLLWLNYSSKAPLTLQKLLLTRLRDEWLEDIEALYDEWALTASAVAEEQRGIFHQAKEEQHSVWLAENADAYPVADTDNETAIDVDMLQRETGWLEDIGVDLCFDLHGAEKQQ